jgi:hypothetical protein
LGMEFGSQNISQNMITKPIAQLIALKSSKVLLKIRSN